MEHPFISDLSEKTMEELQDTITDLNKKLNFAYRTGNSALLNQLQMVIESYKNQHRKKMDELFDKQKLNAQINIQSDKK
jgi:uncharacterized membrane protein (DUF106 family)